MKTIFSFLIAFVCLFTVSSCAQKEEKKEEIETTTYYLIRHAEKDRSDAQNRDPLLTEAGKDRADRWATYFKDINLDGVYSTNYNRTKATAAPTAASKNLTVDTYDPRDLYNDAFAKATLGKSILIVGHSNTTPVFANAILKEEKYPNMADDDNSSLYVVTLTGDQKSSRIVKVD